MPPASEGPRQKQWASLGGSCTSGSNFKSFGSDFVSLSRRDPYFDIRANQVVNIQLSEACVASRRVSPTRFMITTSVGKVTFTGLLCRVGHRVFPPHSHSAPLPSARPSCFVSTKCVFILNITITGPQTFKTDKRTQAEIRNNTHRFIRNSEGGERSTSPVATRKERATHAADKSRWCLPLRHHLKWEAVESVDVVLYAALFSG